MFSMTPPSRFELAQAAFEAVRGRKNGGRPTPFQAWLAAYDLWWSWWAEVVIAEQGVEYYAALVAEGSPADVDRLLGDYPQAAFPFGSRGELQALLEAGGEAVVEVEATQLCLPGLLGRTGGHQGQHAP